jgi:hypothetical protein
MGVGRVAEIVGLVEIIVSLVFLGYELKRSNDIAETEAVATIYSMTNEMCLAIKQAGSNSGIPRIPHGCLRAVEAIWNMREPMAPRHANRHP